MENWIRGLLENMMDSFFDRERVDEIKRQASYFMVEGADEQNLYLGYVNGFVSGYADSAVILMCRKDPGGEEREEIRRLTMRRSEEVLMRFGLL